MSNRLLVKLYAVSCLRSGTGHYHRAVSAGAGPDTIDHCNMREWAQAIHFHSGSEGSALTNSCVHHPGYIGTDHTDRLYLWDGVDNTTVEHNTILEDLPQIDCLYRGPIGGDEGTCWRDNLFAGGGYTLYRAGKSTSGITYFVIENNWFPTATTRIAVTPDPPCTCLSGVSTATCGTTTAGMTDRASADWCGYPVRMSSQLAGLVAVSMQRLLIAVVFIIGTHADGGALIA
jgi:hypothetical protein